jgi:hypothetical protein
LSTLSSDTSPVESTARDLSAIGAFLVSMVFLGVCWAAGGVGHANGDSLVYQVQIEEGDLAQRTIHVGYLCVGMGVRALFNGPLPLLMDHANAVIAAMAVAVVGVASPRAGWLAALGPRQWRSPLGPLPRSMPCGGWESVSPRAFRPGPRPSQPGWP